MRGALVMGFVRLIKIINNEKALNPAEYSPLIMAGLTEAGLSLYDG